MPLDLTALYVDLHRLTRTASKRPRQEHGAEVWQQPFTADEIAAAHSLIEQYRGTV